MKVWLDDLRKEPKGWVRTCTVEETIKLLQIGEVVEISLDNDLGTEKVGMDVIDWIEEQVMTHGFVPPKIHIHTANPYAEKYMMSVRDRIERFISKL